MKTKDIIKERQTTHGEYLPKCDTIQNLKNTIRATEGFWHLSHDQMESLDLICTKIGRILYGNPDTIDHWDDIAGYAQLISQRLVHETTQKDPR